MSVNIRLIFVLFLLAGLAQASTEHDQVILEEAEEAVKQEVSLEKLVNLPFFGTYAGVDSFITQLDKKVCKKADFDVKSLLEERSSHLPLIKRSLALLTKIRDRLNGVPPETLKKLKFSWSYRHYQEDLATLNCVALEGDRLAQSNDYLNSLAAIDLFRAIDGYDSASERGAILVLVNEQYGKEAKVRWPKTLGARDKADKFDILGIALGMTLQDVKVFLPEAVVARDSRGTKSLPQLDTLYVKNLSTGNKIQLRVLIGKPGDAPPTAYDLQYSFDMKGLGLKQIINVIQKLYEKYGKPDLDLTRMAKPFDYDAFLVDLQSQFDPELKYCWGDCAYQNAEKPDEGLAPGIRMEMSFMKEISLLKLRLVNGTGKDDEVIPIKIDEPIAQNLKKTESTTPKTQSTEPHPEEVPVTAPEPTASSKQQDNDQFNPASLFDESEGNTLEF